MLLDLLTGYTVILTKVFFNMESFLDKRGRLPQVGGDCAKATAEMLEALDYRSLADFLSEASRAFRQGNFDGRWGVVSSLSISSGMVNNGNLPENIDITEDDNIEPVFSEENFTNLNFDDD